MRGDSTSAHLALLQRNHVDRHFEVLLAGWSGQDDFCVATGMAARPQPEVEGMFGMLVNTVALRADLRGISTFRELVQRARATTFGAL